MSYLEHSSNCDETLLQSLLTTACDSHFAFHYELSILYIAYIHVMAWHSCLPCVLCSLALPYEFKYYFFLYE